MEVGYVFTPVCLACLPVCVQDVSKRYRLIRKKLDGQVGCVARMNRLDFGEDPIPDPTTIIFYAIVHH